MLFRPGLDAELPAPGADSGLAADIPDRQSLCRSTCPASLRPSSPHRQAMSVSRPAIASRSAPLRNDWPSHFSPLLACPQRRVFSSPAKPHRQANLCRIAPCPSDRPAPASPRLNAPRLANPDRLAHPFRFRPCHARSTPQALPRRAQPDRLSEPSLSRATSLANPCPPDPPTRTSPTHPGPPRLTSAGLAAPSLTDYPCRPAPCPADVSRRAVPYRA